MRVLDLLSAPWALQPDKLQLLIDIYDRHLRHEKADIRAIEAALGRPLNNDPQDYYVQQGVAVLPVTGVLAKRMDLFAEISGGTSTQRLQQQLQAALDDPTAHSIVLLIDSPGGEVDGTQALAADVYAARARKPIVTLGDGVVASAAYWIGSAAERVYITGDTVTVGSIGVVIAHTDISKAQEMRGVKTTEITAGKYKRIASSYAPLSQDGRQSLQDIVDHIYSVTVDEVARNRGVSVEDALKMADGQLFLGKKAISAGLVDGITSLEQLIADLNQRHTTAMMNAGAAAPTGGRTMKEEKTETTALTQAQLEQRDKEAFERGRTEGLAVGATAERERIQAVEAQLMPGHEKLVAGLKFDGKTTGEQAAVRVLQAEKERRNQVGADLVADSPKPVPAADAPTVPAAPAEPDPAEVADKARLYQAEQKRATGRDFPIETAVAHVRKQMGLK